MENFLISSLKELNLENNPEKAQQIVALMKNLANREEWDIIEKVLNAFREQVITALKESPLQMENFMLLRNLIAVIDFMKDLPENLANSVENLYVLKQEE
jgi:hypothetical protein